MRVLGDDTKLLSCSQEATTAPSAHLSSQQQQEEEEEEENVLPVEVQEKCLDVTVSE